ncbi:MAG: radical SAM protein, partial [Pseudomonadota bacterium]
MPSVRLVQPAIAIPRYRQLRMPVVGAELAPYADVSVNDENVEALDFSPVDLAGLTCQTYNADRAFWIADRFREQGVKTILGGVFATAMPEKALEHFDAVVVGELEGLGETIINDLVAGNLRKVYQNPAPPDLSHTRAPRWDLLKSRKYYHVNFPIETTRGCPHQCAFCFSSLQYPGFRKRSLSDIERDLAQWDRGLVEVVDLHFAADREFAIEVCEVFANMGVPGWYGEATLKSLDDDRLLAALEKSKCRQMFVGLESVSPRALSAMNKDFNRVEDFRRVIQKAQDHGVFIHAGFIWGVPGQTQADFDATFQFCEDTNLYLASSNILTPYPGTPWHQELKARGRSLSEDFRDYDSAHVTADPETMTPAQVVE